MLRRGLRFFSMPKLKFARLLRSGWSCSRTSSGSATRTPHSTRETSRPRSPTWLPTLSSTSTATGPISGDHKGPEAISAALIKTFELTNGTQKLDIRSIFADDQHAVITMRETATRPDGASLDLEEAHVITFDPDGRITNLWDLPDDPEAHDRFFDGR